MEIEGLGGGRWDEVCCAVVVCEESRDGEEDSSTEFDFRGRPFFPFVFAFGSAVEFFSLDEAVPKPPSPPIILLLFFSDPAPPPEPAKSLNSLLQLLQHSARVRATSQYRPIAYPMLLMSPVGHCARIQMPSSGSAQGEMESRDREEMV